MKKKGNKKVKTVKTSSINLVICWQGIRNVPPREFASIQEMEDAMKVITVLKKIIPEFVAVFEEMDKPKSDKAKLSNALSELEQNSGDIEIEIEDDVFNTLKTLVDKWGKNWFQKLELFMNFREVLK